MYIYIHICELNMDMMKPYGHMYKLVRNICIYIYIYKLLWLHKWICI